MKFNAIVAIALVTGASAAPQPWCKRPNSICSKVKRAADIVAEVAAQDATAELTHLLTLSEEEPEQYSSEALGIDIDKRSPEPWCKRPNSQCGTAMEKRSPTPWCSRPNSSCPTVAKRSPWCKRPNSICSKVKRAADAVVEVAAEDATEELSQLLENNEQHSEVLGFSDKTMDKRWCTRPLSNCPTKRSPWCKRPNSICSKVKRSPWCKRPNSICSKVKRSLVERAPEPWCHRPNSMCWKVRRALSLETRSPWCTRPLSNCPTVVKRTPWCKRPNSICSKVKRSLSLETRSPWCTRPLSNCPTVAKRSPWCKRPNSICSKAKRAVDVFADTVLQSVKQDSAAPQTASEAAAHDAVLKLAQLAAQSSESPEDYIKYLGLEDNKTVAKRDVESTSETEAEEKEACHAEGGACWAAKRAVDAVLATVDAEQDDAEDDAECSQRGEACWHQKRQLGALRFAANDISSSLL
ncbi:hypothetical protein CDD80_3828 [Ophiocordyceps camponoti-rufipedis]|uniref:Clock-controlled pheromone ccg-4 n=1 Tax=Ophiocordyceps camponoti-rufipedis TaxID=2004952 RepID=A0A2C5Z077_9HYPO|nr:hypothetical protein CDD80_3828 [Ophiocordyceps camponoti-rufipedis]